MWNNGNGVLEKMTVMMRQFTSSSRSRAPNMRKINPRVPYQEAAYIAEGLYGIIKSHGPLTIGNAWNYAKDSSINGLNSKTHMKLVLKWMRGRSMLKQICNRVGSNKKFLLTTLPSGSQEIQPDSSVELNLKSEKTTRNKKRSRPVGSDDISLKILHCGVCYADVAWTRSKHGQKTKYPVVPGHEIVGVITEVGSNVQRFKVGEHVGVGTFVNSCRQCEYCESGDEIHCIKGAVYTFDGVDEDGTITKGGYSNFIVVHQRYCLRIPENYPLEFAAPLLCAGITVYTPMMRHNMNQPGNSLGVIGLGGLGHLAVKFGKAFGLKVTVFSTSISKKEDSLNLLGADDFVISTDEDQMKAYEKSLNFIINTASADIPFDQYLSLLKPEGVLVLVGFPSVVKINPGSLAGGSKTIARSITGGLKRTQEMLDFCAFHKIHPLIEQIPIDYSNEALERLIKKDVKFRFVIDIANSLK